MEKEYLEKMVATLNEAVALDKDAIQAMLCYQVPVSDGFIDHPTIQVKQGAERPALTFLGLLNGLHSSEDYMIATMWSDSVDASGRCDFLGFVLVDSAEISYTEE